MALIQDSVAASPEVTPLQVATADSSSVGESLPVEWVQRLTDAASWTELGFAGLKILGLVVAAVALIRALDRLAIRSTERFESLPEGNPRRQRAITVSGLVSSTGRYVIWPAAGIMILAEFGLNVSALIATAGIAGLAIGFGAQTLVKDVIAGFFLLFDDTIHVGDTIKVNDQVGVVEAIGIRLIRMRRLDGELVMIPAGELRVFGNRSVGFARVVCEVDLAYEQNIDLVTNALSEVALEWAEANRDILLEDTPETQSILGLTESTVRLRVVVKVRPGEQWRGQRALLHLIKRRFDERGIEFPFPRRTVYVRQE